MLALTGARGLMIGRGGDSQSVALPANPPASPRRSRSSSHAARDVLDYIHALYDAVCSPDVAEVSQVQKMKKYLNFIGLGVEPTGHFLHAIRRAMTRAEFFRICAEYLDHDDPMALEPFQPALNAGDVLAGEHG